MTDVTAMSLRLDLPDDDGSDRRRDARKVAADSRPGRFDLIVIDKAPSLCVPDTYPGDLPTTSTASSSVSLQPPKDEIDINTYQLFELERGVPTDAYPLEDAIKDKFLVPPIAVSVPIKFQRQGITYKDLSPEAGEVGRPGVGGRRPDTRQGGVICAKRVTLRREQVLAGSTS